MNHFLIKGPTCISFSGGRTSAYMLWKVLEAHGGKLPDETVVLFANTGKEMPETLQFVHDCSVNWNVPVVWLEYTTHEDLHQRYKVVTFETAARNGEPFEEMIEAVGKPFLPNPVMRICTVRLKIDPFYRYCRSLGWVEYDNFIGIRADEQRRAAKIRANPDDGRSGVCRLVPLADAGVTKEEVGDFWRKQSFDLGLPNMNGVTMHGNCDLCFLKPLQQIASLIAENPERAVWWAQMEKNAEGKEGAQKDSSKFRKDRPSYAELAKYTAAQRDIFDPNEEGISCFCGD